MERLATLGRRLPILEGIVQPRQELPRRLAFLIQPISIPTQDVTDQRVQVPVLAKSHSQYVMDFTRQSLGPSLTNPPKVALEQRLPCGTSVKTSDQPGKAFAHFWESLAKAESYYFDTRLEIEGQRIGAWWRRSFLHKCMTSILPHDVNTSNAISVDNITIERDIKRANTENRA